MPAKAWKRSIRGNNFCFASHLYGVFWRAQTCCTFANDLSSNCNWFSIALSLFKDTVHLHFYLNFCRTYVSLCLILQIWFQGLKRSWMLHHWFGMSDEGDYVLDTELRLNFVKIHIIWWWWTIIGTDAHLAYIFCCHLIASTVVAHAGDGNFHTLVLFDPTQEEQRQEAERLNQFMVHAALSLEGTLHPTSCSSRIINIEICF